MVSSMPRKLLEPVLQLLMDGLRAADKAHAGQAVSPILQRLLRGGDDGGMIRQAEVVVRAEIEDHATGNGDRGLLRAGNDALALIEAGLFDLGQLLLKMILHRSVHRAAHS